MVHAFQTVILIEMNNHFGIAVCVKAVAAVFQSCTKLGKVIDFTVEYDPDSPILVVNWLAAHGKIDNAEPPHAQACAAHDMDPFIIRAAVHDGLTHSAYIRSIGHIAAVTANDAGYSTHSSTIGLTNGRGRLRSCQRSGKHAGLAFAARPFMRPILEPPIYRTVSLQAPGRRRHFVEHLCNIARSTDAHHPQHRS